MPLDQQRGRVLTTQVMVGALILGVSTLTVVFAVLVQQGGGPAGGSGGSGSGGSKTAGALVITSLILTVAFILVGYGLLPLLRGRIASFVMRKAPEKVDAEAVLLPVWQNGVIVSAAMVEAGGLLGAVAYYLSAQPEALASPVLAILAMAAMFPTEGRFRAFVQRSTGRNEFGP